MYDLGVICVRNLASDDDTVVKPFTWDIVADIGVKATIGLLTQKQLVRYTDDDDAYEYQLVVDITQSRDENKLRCASFGKFSVVQAYFANPKAEFGIELSTIKLILQPRWKARKIFARRSLDIGYAKRSSMLKILSERELFSEIPEELYNRVTSDDFRDDMFIYNHMGYMDIIDANRSYEENLSNLRDLHKFYTSQNISAYIGSMIYTARLSKKSKFCDDENLKTPAPTPMIGLMMDILKPADSRLTKLYANAHSFTDKEYKTLLTERAVTCYKDGKPYADYRLLVLDPSFSPLGLPVESTPEARELQMSLICITRTLKQLNAGLYPSQFTTSLFTDNERLTIFNAIIEFYGKKFIT